jgi:hypothetical protein
MSLFAALVAVGVWGMTRELCGSGAWGLAAALLWTALPTSYRTLAFVLMREDFSLPIYALHLLLMLRAARVRSAGAFVAAGATAGLAAATWHAMGSFLLIEMACIVLWFARTRQNPFAPPRAWLGLAALLVVGLAVPVLRTKGFVLSAPVVAAAALAAAAVAARRGAGRGTELAVFGGAAVLLLGAAWVLAGVTGSGLYDYAHVFGFLWDKVRHLGVLPADPAELSFDSRLLWQGPFVTTPLAMLINWLGLTLVPLLVVLARAGRSWLSGKGDGRIAVFAAVALLVCAMSWLIVRTYVVAGILTSVATAVVLADRRLRALAPILLLVVVG